ncbi:BON domain-containing protein [Salinimicrobium sp. TH3]|uniref:BON domain-containing protein n=1 Tax=Salinimicrobium sp. TH3 TaxID=2997342 RepID=UPI0022770599|nr:BON domain-containing protein [Salinimicrobium sp. TH3]MCY2685875.1 BON domain-containing protein [Salinimicrobium sp. TH3]
MRADQKIKEEVVQQLEWEPHIDATGIGIAVRDGIVTLSGRVGTYYEKLLAEKAVSKVRGVRAVVEKLKTEISQSNERSDETIAKAALNHLKSHSQVPFEQINLKVEEGFITLEGEVDWNYQREAAQKAIQFLTGVRGVKNNLKVRPATKPDDLKRKIRDSFERNAVIDADHIDIKLIGHRIILSGSVHSWLEKKQAEKIALNAPGINKVENNILIKTPQDYVE